MRYFETQTLERVGYDFYCDVAARMVEARGMKGWSREELAAASGISLSRLGRMERVEIRIKLEDIEALAKALDVTVNWLIDAEVDSQIGECAYIVWVERVPGFRLYQKSTSKRLAFLQFESRINKLGCRAAEPRDRFFVKLVGVPVTDQEIKDHFPKLSPGDEPIEREDKPDA